MTAPTASVDAPVVRRWPRWARRGRMEMLACAVIATGLAMMLQPFAMILYTWSFATIVIGTALFIVVSLAHFQQAKKRRVEAIALTFQTTPKPPPPPPPQIPPVKVVAPPPKEIAKLEPPKIKPPVVIEPPKPEMVKLQPVPLKK